MRPGETVRRLSHRRRVKTLRIDTIVDTHQPLGGDCDALEKIGLEFTRQGHITIDQRGMHPTQPLMPAAAPPGIEHVPAVLAMYPRRHSRQHCRQQGLETAEVAGMHDRRAQAPKQAVQAPLRRQVVAFFLVNGKDLDVRPGDALTKLGEVLHTDDGMPEALRRQAVDQIHDAVLETANSQAEDHVGDQRTTIGLCLARGLAMHWLVISYVREVPGLLHRPAREYERIFSLPDGHCRRDFADHKSGAAQASAKRTRSPIQRRTRASTRSG